jgi:hypothetical protein
LPLIDDESAGITSSPPVTRRTVRAGARLMG